MTALGDHAARELDLMGVGPPIRAATIGIVGTFADLTAADQALVNDYVNTLVSFLPLSSLTNNPDHWVDRSDLIGGKPYWQSIRNPDAWSRDRGMTYYLQSEQGKIYTSDPA